MPKSSSLTGCTGAVFKMTLTPFLYAMSTMRSTEDTLVSSCVSRYSDWPTKSSRESTSWSVMVLQAPSITTISFWLLFSSTMMVTSAPALWAATPWLNPLPPGPILNTVPFTVSPAAGRCGVLPIKSTTKLPNTVTFFPICSIICSLSLIHLAGALRTRFMTILWPAPHRQFCAGSFLSPFFHQHISTGRQSKSVQSRCRLRFCPPLPQS